MPQSLHLLLVLSILNRGQMDLRMLTSGNTDLSMLTPSNTNLSMLTPRSDHLCPLSFHRIGTRCYFYGFFKLNWFRAMEFCHSFGRGSSLAALNTHRKNWEVKAWLLQHGDSSTGVWIGGSDNGHHGRWAWFPTGQLLQWYDWGQGQPSGTDQHCLYIVGGFLGYQWADFHCEFEMTFLCELHVNPGNAWTLPVTQDKSHQSQSELFVRPTPPSLSPTQNSPPTTPPSPTPPPASYHTNPPLRSPQPSKHPIQLYSILAATNMIKPQNVSENLVEEEYLEDNFNIKVQGENSLIKVLSSDKSTVIINKHEETMGQKVTNPEDDSSWSILQFLKNIIRMPRSVMSAVMSVSSNVSNPL